MIIPAGGFIFGIAVLFSIILLAIALLMKMEKIKELNAQVAGLKKSLDETDEQARLIIRTDMELNKTQGELDKKIAGLYALQRLSRSISTSLEESQIFKRIDHAQLDDLGFEKACGFLWGEAEKEFSLKFSLGYAPDWLGKITAAADLNSFYLELIKKEKTVSSNSLKQEAILKNRIGAIFAVNSFVISPILSKEGSRGFLFVGTDNPDTFITEGDEELITILANQLGEALENARLFEQAWRAQQDLEKKVEERTKELSRALEEVKNISKRKTDFISSVSHELRTPLTSIKGYASILLAGQLGAVPEQIAQRLDKINRHSDELVHMVNDLLDIARIESGKITMKKETLDLKEIIDGVADLLAVQLKEKQIEFSAHIEEGAKIISADRSQIQRVFINLLGNAIKFTPAKGKIFLSTHKTDNAVEVDISDTGCGIPEKDIDAVFEEFYRVDNPINQQVKGTGLGLSLVKHIIEAHAGKIWVKSKAGQGSTFSFILPKQ
jgi:signal transduction histidine kinase